MSSDVAPRLNSLREYNRAAQTYVLLFQRRSELLDQRTGVNQLVA